MSENICYLCQEPKSVVGHNTQTCPSVKCKKCGQKGHIVKNCPNFNLNVDPKPDNVYAKEIKSLKSVYKEVHVLHNETKILMDFIYKDIGGFDDSNPKLEVNEETLKTRSSGKDQRPGKVDQIISGNMEIKDSIHNIEFSNDIKPKFEVKEEMLKVKSSRIDLKPYMVDPIFPNDEAQCPRTDLNKRFLPRPKTTTP